VQITVLGKSPSWEDAGGACSGYLVEQDGFRLLLDCGSGVFAKLRLVCDYTEVDAVLLSHLHADHFLDLVPYSYALLHGPHRDARPHLHAPTGAGELFRRVVGAWGSEDLIDTAFDLSEYDSGAELALGPLTARFHPVPHFTTTFAIDLSSASGARFTFSADCGPNDAVVELAAGTDLLLIEATLPSPDDGGDRGHLTPREAGEHGRRAGAGRLVLTHYSDQLDVRQVAADAAEGFGSEVELAREGAVYTL
jgi:ribonuclease BN (tRNA processing enzyme)